MASNVLTYQRQKTLSHEATTVGRSVSQTVLIKMSLNVVWRSNSHREVNTLRPITKTYLFCCVAK